MRRSLIVALTRQGVIGKDNKLPWRLSDDLRRFKSITMGHCLVMGRKTLESLGRLLPGRTTIVLSRQDPVHLSAKFAGLRVAHNLSDAITKASGDDELFIIGGGEVFREALPQVSRLYVTWVEADVPGDVYFPPLDLSEWKLVEEETVPADEHNEYPTTYCVYDRLIAFESSSDHAADSDEDDLLALEREAEALADAAPQISIPADSPTTQLEPTVPNSNVPLTVSVEPFAMSASSVTEQELLQLNQQLLNAIVGGDWNAYAQLCDPSISCFEPEARGELVVGMAFHKYYFDLPASGTKAAKNVTMAQPHVRMLGDAAVLSYVRLTQFLDGSGAPQTSRVEETRVWQKIAGQWKHVHFHRAIPS